MDRRSKQAAAVAIAMAAMMAGPALAASGTSSDGSLYYTTDHKALGIPADTTSPGFAPGINYGPGTLTSTNGDKVTFGGNTSAYGNDGNSFNDVQLFSRTYGDPFTTTIALASPEQYFSMYLIQGRDNATVTDFGTLKVYDGGALLLTVDLNAAGHAATSGTGDAEYFNLTSLNGQAFDRIQLDSPGAANGNQAFMYLNKLNYSTTAASPSALTSDYPAADVDEPGLMALAALGGIGALGMTSRKRRRPDFADTAG